MLQGWRRCSRILLLVILSILITPAPRVSRAADFRVPLNVGASEGLRPEESSRPAAARSDVCADPASGDCFEALAAQAGRAEAWQLLYGTEPQVVAAGADTGAVHAEPLVLPRMTTSSDSSQAGAESAAGPASGMSVSAELTPVAYLPLVIHEPVMVERRAIWVTRYDWTTLGVAPAPEVINTIVNQVAAAGFNTIFFQVRAAGDAYYTPGLEPWAARLNAGPVSEALGKDPGWDPLARMIALGHAAGLEIHAYVNVYTAWQSPSGTTPAELAPPATTPPQMFDRFTYGPAYAAHPGEYALRMAWRHWSDVDEPMNLSSNQYLWASPGLDVVNAYVAAVVRDIVQRYPVDGVHLDLVRYAGVDYSYDPASNRAAGEIKTDARDQWQRNRITALVRQITAETHSLRPGTMVSAAVWPYYIDKWGWNLSEGYHVYYQDSKGWLSSGAVDAIAPMLYGSDPTRPSVPDVPGQWEMLMLDFLGDSGGRPVYPGIGAHYDFADIAWRIEHARQAGAPGHVIFSYGGLNARGYWDDLANGPYRRPAVLP